MRSENIIMALGHIDDDIIETVDTLRNRKNRDAHEQQGGTIPRYSSSIKKILYWKRLVPVAAFLVAIVIIAATYGDNAGWFDNRVYTVDLVGGETLRFYKIDALGGGSLDFGSDVISRDLTTEENKAIFGEMPIAAHGLFDSSNGELLHIEGRYGNIKIVLTAQGVSSIDTVIDTSRVTTEVNAIPVSAGYFITKANSQGIRNIVFIASFDISGYSVYVESWGVADERETLREEIASAIVTVIEKEDDILKHSIKMGDASNFYFNVPLEECELIPSSVKTVTDVYEFETGIDSLERYEIIDDGVLFQRGSITRIMWGDYFDDDERGFVAVIKCDTDGIMTGMVYRTPVHVS